MSLLCEACVDKYSFLLPTTHDGMGSVRRMAREVATVLTSMEMRVVRGGGDGC